MSLASFPAAGGIWIASERVLFAPHFHIFMAERDFDYEMSLWESPTQVIVMFRDALLVWIFFLEW